MDDIDLDDDGAEEFSEADAGAQFMLAEFANMRYFHQEETAINERRVDVLLAITSGIAAGLALLAQTGIDSQFLLGIALLGCIGLLLIGTPTFFDTLRRDITAVDYIRALNGVREYFIQRAPGITPHLLMPANTAYPRYGSISSSRRASAAVNSLAAGALDAALRMFVLHEQRPTVLTVLVAAGVMLATFIAHWIAWRSAYAYANCATRDTRSFAMLESQELEKRQAKRHGGARLRKPGKVD